MQLTLAQAQLLVKTVTLSKVTLAPRVCRALSGVLADLKPLDASTPAKSEESYGILMLTQKEARKLAGALYSTKISLYSSDELNVLSDILQKLKGKPEIAGKSKVKRILTAPIREQVCLACKERKLAKEFYLYQIKGQAKIQARCKRCVLAASKQARDATTALLSKSKKVPPGLKLSYDIAASELLQAQQALRGYI